MYCNFPIRHIVMRGDSLYKIAKHYGTTVAEVLSLNPGVNPMNLRIGSKITVCSDKLKQDHSLNKGSQPDFLKKLDLSNQMRLAWEQHVYWTRMLLISIAERLADENEVTARLLQNPADIAKIFGKYYGQEAAQTIAQLLTEHLAIGKDLITALRDGKN